MTKITKTIHNLYFGLFFLLPLSFLTITSELFEFNKMIVVYFATALIASLFIVDRVLANNFTLQKSRIYIPLIAFLVAMGLSTIVSIDFKSSMFGYYSRFHGGLVSFISYSILSVIYLNVFDKKSTLQSIKVLIASTIAASLYAFVEHYGYSFSCLFVTKSFSAECWVQDVQNRVFGTFGQPNWLSAWLVAIIPLASFLSTESLRKSAKNSVLFYTISSFLFILVLYFTKSRSGFLAFAVAFIIFWLANFYIYKSKIIFKNLLALFSINLLFIFLITIFVQTPWQPQVASVAAQEYVAPALEGGGTESGDIRRIVWTGAIELFKKYPLLGTGLDTFAYSYYETRPAEHNMVSEWNYVYNRAHNEYLNFLATTGIVGTIAYTVLILAFFYIILQKINLVRITLAISLLTILITNFFGFSTVAVSTLMFLIPAMAITSDQKAHKYIEIKPEKINQNQKSIIAITTVVGIMLLIIIGRYWLADLYYAKGQKNRKIENYQLAAQQLNQAINLNGKEASFHVELSEISLYLGDIKSSDKHAELAIRYSPHDVAIHKQVARVYSKLSTVDPSFSQKEYRVLEKLMNLAPTDPSVYYMYASFLARVGDLDNSIAELEKIVVMKPDFKLARTLLAYIYEDIDQLENAKIQYLEILKYYPDDEKIKEDLEKLEL